MGACQRIGSFYIVFPVQTQILKIFDLLPAIACLKRGDPVVFPTETVYGLGAPLFNEAAVRRIFAIKGRPLDNPLIAHIACLEEAGSLSDGLNADFYALAEAFWPGPLTMVVKRRIEVPALVSAGQPTIAIRMPSHPVARQLIKAVGEPLVAPSANLSGRPSPTRLQDVLEDLNGKVAFVIDGGESEVGIESTVISLFHPVPTLLRPGKITREMLEEVLGRPVALPCASGPIVSPGMKYRHYAPKAPVRLVYQLEDLRGPFISPTPKTLYAQLREADRMGAAQIEIYCDEAVRRDAALMNRLLRAAGEIV
jgi:L-threonylcarbamoyladenylate synthase